MFRCGNCNRVVEARQPEHKIITETRDMQYRNTVLDKEGNETSRLKFSEGYEVEKEISACPECYEVITGEKPQAKRDQIEEVKAKGFNQRPVRRKWQNPRNKNNEGQDKRPKKKGPEVEHVKFSKK